jgi:hypothetical protein
VALFLATSCADVPLAGSLEIELIIVPGMNPLANATHLRMRIDDGQRHTWPLGERAEFMPSFDVAADGQLHQLFVEGLDGDGAVTARGESAPVRFDEGVHARLRVVPRAVGKFSATVEGLAAPRLLFGLAGDASHGLTLIGGLGDVVAAGSTATTQVEHIDPYLGTVRSLPDIPVARRSPVAMRSTSGALIVGLGGVADMHWLAADAAQWEVASTQVQSVYDAALIGGGVDRWYAVGGFDAVGGPSDQVAQFTMTAGGPMAAHIGALLTTRDRPSIAPMGERFLVAGGSAILLAEILEVREGASIRCQAVSRPPEDPSTVFTITSVSVDDGVLLMGDARTRVLHVSPDGQVRGAGNLSMARSGPAATRLDDGRILVSGGEGAPNTAELLTLIDGMWTPSEIIVLTQPRTHHRSVKIAGGNVLLIGGSGAAGLLWLGDIYTPR